MDATARKSAWVKPLVKVNLKDIQSEQVVEYLTQQDAPRPATAAAALDEDFALALRLQEEEGGLPEGITQPSTQPITSAVAPLPSPSASDSSCFRCSAGH